MSARAFSLLELLVVIGIMVLLAALVVPAVQHAQSYARDATCRSNLRQVFLGQQTYATDHRRFTAVWSQADPVSWRTRLHDYLGANEDVVHCSAVAPSRHGEIVVDGVESPLASYALNGAMQFREWDFQPTRVAQPAQTIAIAEQPMAPYESAVTADRYGVWSTGSLTNWHRVPDHQPDRGYRHRGEAGANVAMMDGHVRRLTHAELYRDAGHWYWFNALAHDTASGSADPGDGPEYVMAGGPSPGPVGPGGDPPSIMPDGPLIAPCGCVY